MWLLRRWLDETADLVWMLVLRSRLVCIVMFATFLFLVVATYAILPGGLFYAIRFACALFAAPLIGRPLCDVTSYLRARKIVGGGWTRHVFEQARLELRQRYQSDQQAD